MKRWIALALMLVLVLGITVPGEEYYDDRNTIVAMLGDESRFVYTVELALFEKGYLLEDEIDGIFDEYTEMAVMNFQAYKNFECNGMLTKNQFYWLHRTYYREWFDSSDIVWITENGTRYHQWDCSSIHYSTGLMPISVNIAENLGYQPCRICLYYY